jgi:hypothetical protein
MQRFLPAILVALAVAAGVFAYFQYDSAASLRREIAETGATRERVEKAESSAQSEITRLRAEIDAAKENIARLAAERDAALARAKNSAGGGAPPAMTSTPPTAPEKAGNPMMEGIAKMFQTEDGKKMMRSQMAMGVKMQYAGLAKDLKLDPKVADQVMGLLGDREAALTEAAFSSMNTLDEAAEEKIVAKSEALQKDYDAKLKAVLGEQGAAQLKDYERTLVDRMMLTNQEQQFAAAGAPLVQAQRDSLLQIMKDERLKTPPTTFNAANAGDTSKAFKAMRDHAAVEKWLKQEEEYQQRVLQTATKALNPDQVNTLRDSFKQQLDMQRLGVKMSKEFGGAVIAPISVSEVFPPAPPVKEAPAK